MKSTANDAGAFAAELEAGAEVGAEVFATGMGAMERLGIMIDQTSSARAHRFRVDRAGHSCGALQPASVRRHGRAPWSASALPATSHARPDVRNAHEPRAPAAA